MANVLIDDTNLTNIANAIREKNGTTTTYKPGEMAGAISAIETGSSITKGLIINECNSNGYPTDVSLIGMTEVPDAYFVYAWYDGALGGMSVTGETRPWLYNATLHLPETLTTIGNSSFYYCSGLTSEKLGGSLPNSITTIKKYAFTSCEQLNLTELPPGLTTIEERVFSNCYMLALTELPSGITSIGTRAFQYCETMTLTELPSGITTISDYAFYGCAGLTELTCNGVITTISASAFNGCSSLAKFVLPNVTSVPTLSNKNAFTNTPIASGTGYIYVPDDLVSSFKSATNWSTYSSQIKGLSELPS